MARFEESYHGQLRQLVGNRKLIIPAVRAVILTPEQEVVLIRRRDNQRWGLPAGSLELNESVSTCLKREVEEETGLKVVAATAIAIYSEPRFAFTNAFGGEHQMYTLLFRIDQWEGTLAKQTEETSDAAFFACTHLPEMPSHNREAIADTLAFDGHFIVK